jgi:hypothetical protein
MSPQKNKFKVKNHKKEEHPTHRQSKSFDEVIDECLEATSIKNSNSISN